MIGHSEIIAARPDETGDDASCFERYESPEMLDIFWGRAAGSEPPWESTSSGITLPCEDDRFSFIFSFDAMAHFELRTMAAHVSEIAGTLRLRGKAVPHDSSYSNHPARSFRQDPHRRNFMPEGWMAHHASGNGLSVISSERFRWPGKSTFSPPADALTVFDR